MLFRVLLLADTHLGFDLPWRPRVERRRRGPDFFANYERALAPAVAGEVDLVVHGGDVLFRSKVRPQLVQMAFEPLMRVADAGVPVVVVPGNHERSAIPYPLLATHPDVHILSAPRTVRLEIRGSRVAVAGFPFQRHDVQGRFRQPGSRRPAGGRRRRTRACCAYTRPWKEPGSGRWAIPFAAVPTSFAAADLPEGFRGGCS